ncbi:Zinc-binding alcohol dehydrogenase domain-containing cipB [Lecanosticta acicola]|uniref:Zinc-binding alcohol dehydrogenase domain-containing cipB n=1 Tax=Lecanosticta acicola TaxID=111012 RepID=A0AAI8Z702_9PEZI|nr:Zinc-binding alcohol dehydrogenase domain-containing cipB [Lecanosticta acicola]
MTTNQAAWIDGPGKEFRVGESKIPTPGADDVVVKNHAVAVNPVDWKIQDHGLFIKEWPTVLGCDIAGEVHEVGSNVKQFKKGDRVFSHAISLATGDPADGAFQLYTKTQAVLAAKIPDSISYNHASVLPLAVDTAGHGLYDSREKGFMGLPHPSLEPKPSGKTILIWGASGSVGALATQLATASGAKVIAVASARNHNFVKQLGAAEAFDYNTSSVVDDVVKAIKAAGGDFAGIYDTISTPDANKYVFEIAEKIGGTNVCITLPPPEKVPSSVKLGQVFAINNAINGPLWEKYLTPALEQGKLKAVPEPLVVGKGLESVQKGLAKNKEGVSAKKVVIEL